MTGQCNSHTISGSRCQHQAGHEGTHQIVKPTWSYEWTDESEAANADKVINSGYSRRPRA